MRVFTFSKTHAMEGLRPEAEYLRRRINNYSKSN